MLNIIFHAFILLLGVFAALHALFFVFDRLRTWKKFWSGEERRDYSPNASVLMAVRGMDEHIDNTIRSLSRQEYKGKYEVVIVADDDRKAYGYIRKKCARLKNFRVFISPPPQASSGKAVALLLGVRKSRYGVLAFCDSDELLGKDWLESVVGPLQDASAATGYRLYNPAGFIPTIIAAWNNIGLMRSIRKPYVMGGSWAIRKKTFFAAGIHEGWKTAVAEDAAATNKLAESGMEIKLAPSALVFSEYSDTFSHIKEFTTRQLTLIRWHMPGLWKIAAALFLAESIFTVLGLVLLFAYSSSENPIFLLESVLFLSHVIFGFLKASIDRRNLEKIMRRNIPKLRYLLADFTAQWLMAYNLASAGIKKSIVWRGRKYTLDGKLKVENQ